MDSAGAVQASGESTSQFVVLSPPIYSLTHSLTLIPSLSLTAESYHADQVEGLLAKDVTMVPQQPVATTVLYEKPGTEGDVVDDGKDSVFWIPKPLAGASRHNGQSRFGGTYDNEYCAFMSLQTSHGGEHIQAAGQQQIAKHGVFPTLPIGRADKFKPREGARVAVTARISTENAHGGAELFRNKGAYKEIKDCASSQPIAIEWNPYVFDT